MSKVLFKISKPMQLPHSYSTKSFNNKTKDKTISSPDSANFTKVSGFGIIGTSGLSPVIIYRKNSKDNIKLQKFKINRQIKNNNYISDGGLRQKLEKYNFAFNSSQISFPQTSKNKTTKNRDKKNHNLFLEEKKAIKDIKKPNFEDIKLFSKTVRESNKRPIFPKTEKHKNNEKNAFWKNDNDNNNNNIDEEKEKKIREEKYLLMNELYENGIANEIRKYQEKKFTPKEILNERKKECLLDNGIELENDLNNIEEEGNMSEEIKEEEISKNHADVNINIRKNKSSNKLYKSQIEFNHDYISLHNFGIQSMTTKNKKVYKPHVDQFGYIKKIKKEQQKLNDCIKSKPKLEIDNYQSLGDLSRFKKNKNRFKEEEKRQEREDNIDLKKVRINNFFQENSTKKMSEETQSTNDNYPYSHRRSYRKPEELKSFLRLKRMQEREDKKSKEIENNKKLFIRFKNLYNLSMKDLFEDQYQKIDPTPRSKMIKSKSNYNINNSSKKKKELNEYYIGTENSIRNNSTLVDQNEYFLHILESQQLLVNSKLKKIDNISDTESNAENEEETYLENNEINNEINNTKEQINKITDKSKTSKTPSSLSSNNGILNLTNFDNLKQKIDNTLKRVNQVFSKENWKKLKETSNTNSHNNNDEYETSNNLNSNSNINSQSKSKSKEKDKEKNETATSKNKSGKKNNTFQENNIKDLKVKTHELNIDTTNVNNKITNSEVNTKEKNFPSLSHTYSTNSNPNKKVEIEIEPRAVLNLVEILKFIIQRKVFVTLYESYINHSIFQQYNMAFSYFVAICKHYPYRKIEEYANYRTYNFAFRQLFRPFIRRALRYFMSNLYMKKKVEYLVLMLTKLFKFKVFEKIYLCNPFFEDDNQRAFKIIIMKILSTLIKPHLKQVFVNFRNVAKKLEKIDKKKDNKDNSDKKPDINIKKIVQKKIEKDFFDEQSYSLEEKSMNKRADVSMKMNTFLYNSSSDESSLNIEPNSVDNDKLHKLRERLRNSYGDPDDFLGFNYDGMKLHDNSLELETYLGINNRKIRKLSQTNSDNNSSKKSKSNTNSNKKNFNKKNLIDEGNNTEDKPLEEENIEDKKEKTKEKEKEKEKKPSNFEEKKRNIKIDIEDSPVLKPEFKGKNSNSENDISADKDLNLFIDWEYSISEENQKNKNKKKLKNDKDEINFDEKKELKDSKKSDDEYGTFEDISLDEEKENSNKVIKDEKKNGEKKEEKKEKENFLISNENKQDKSRNFKQDAKIKNDSNDIKENIKSDKFSDQEKIIEETDSTKKIKKSKYNLNELIKSIKDINIFADDLTNEIIKDILQNEIKSPKKKLLPSKKFKFDKFDKMNNTNRLSNSLTNSFGSIGEMRSSSNNLSKEFGLNQISFHEDLLSLNDSLMSNYSALSVFNKTIKDKKKEHSLKLYLTKIAPKLIKIVYKEIINKYPLIYKNVSQPLKNISDKFMISLALKNREMLRDNFKCLVKEESIENIIDKEKILKQFSIINKQIRNTDNLTSDDFYDNMLNDCIIDTAIELIYKERKYGTNGTPLKWSSRTYELSYKYDINAPKKFANNICKQLVKILYNRIGLINDNYDYMSIEQINVEKERRLLKVIKKDLNDNEYQWNNLELEETQLKLEGTEAILDQLYNEVIEILEHIQYSRIRPELYQNKSIYACEEIPKLSFQQTTTEDFNAMADSEDK